MVSTGRDNHLEAVGSPQHDLVSREMFEFSPWTLGQGIPQRRRMWPLGLLLVLQLGSNRLRILWRSKCNLNAELLEQFLLLFPHLQRHTPQVLCERRISKPIEPPNHPQMSTNSNRIREGRGGGWLTFASTTGRLGRITGAGGGAAAAATEAETSVPPAVAPGRTAKASAGRGELHIWHS